MIDNSLIVNLWVKDIALYTENVCKLKLRAYQEQVIRCIVQSIVGNKGLSIVVVFPRQSGKNEMQAQLENYLLTIFSQVDGEIVKISPTWKPQSLNAMRRLERVLSRNILLSHLWQKESGYIYRVGATRVTFLSGSPTANVVGATANVLLECDEAQDVLISKWDKEFAPMAASTNATRVFWGTMWTSRTLLARELRAAREAEKKDGQKRTFVMTAEEVAKEVPAYGQFVSEQVAKLGRNHPLVKTQFFSEEIDAEGGMFPTARLALMKGYHQAQLSPDPEKQYALLLDVAGEDEAADQEIITLRNPGRDSTALTVVEIDLTTVRDDLIKAPSYRTVNRYQWTGVKHTTLYGRIKALADHWKAKYLVVDATGVGAGLASFLDKAMPGRVLPFVFTSRTKSDLGWNYLAVIETGRYKDYLFDKTAGRLNDLWNAYNLQTEFWRQAENCQSVVLDGPGRMMRWGVPDGTRDPSTGELVHDDLLISAALCTVLDEQEWGVAESAVVCGLDPLAEFDDVF
jgi:hypothetical protein